MGKKEEPFNLQETKQKVKAKQKENEMKNIKSNSTVRTIATVTITLLTVAAFIGTFLAGMNYQKNQDDTIKREAVSLAEQMATSKQ